MTDSQKPDYNNPWCWKCEQHTRFKTIIHTNTCYTGTSKTTQHVCAICGKTVFRPAAVDFAYYGKVGRRCAWIYFAIAISCIMPLINWAIGNGVEDADKLLGVGFTVLVFWSFPRLCWCGPVGNMRHGRVGLRIVVGKSRRRKNVPGYAGNLLSRCGWAVALA